MKWIDQVSQSYITGIELKHFLRLQILSLGATVFIELELFVTYTNMCNVQYGYVMLKYCIDLTK